MKDLKERVIQTFYKGNISNKINSALIGYINSGKNKDHDLIVQELVLYFGAEYQLSEMLYLITRDLKHPPKCVNDNCTNIPKFIRQTVGYGEYCSKECAGSDPKRVIKIHNTKVAQYGNNYQEHFDSIKRKTNMEKYGVEFPLQSNSIRNKTIITQKERYGQGVGFQNNNIQLKGQNTLLAKYGNRSGNAFVVPSIRSLITKDFLIEQHHILKLSLSTIAIQTGASLTFLRYKMREYNLDIKLFHSSGLETIITNFLDVHNISYNKNDRQLIKYELDIVIPEFKIAIECDGLWYHSERYGYDNNRHLLKRQLCEEQSFVLLHFFENDYLKIDVLFNIISEYLNLLPIISYENTIFKLITNEQTNQFIEDHYIYSHVVDGINIGSFIGEELVQVLAVVKISSGVWEITNFSSIIGVKNEHCFKRIWEFFISTYNPDVVTFKIDNRLFSGNYLLQYGFILDHMLAPICWYFQDNKQSILISSEYQRKHIKLFDDRSECIDSLKEHQYNRIWDCGHEVWKWTKTN